MEEYVGGGRPEDVALLKRETARAEAKGKQQVAKAEAQATAAGKEFVPPPPMKEAIPAIVSGAGERALAAKGITAKSWFATSTGRFDAYRAVEKQLTDSAVEETEQISADARQDALINAVIVLAALLLAFFLAAMMARSMSRSMQNLRTAAFGIAEQRLPMLVDQLSRTDPGRVDTRVAPIPIDSSDEIGEVARAFDQVHREAVRLAAEQALLRGNVNAIFTNLSSRNQGLIERQLGLISDLENNEADPDQLESLFRLDHLATRMRRNGENLLVLAGEEPGRRWNEPIPLIDILRAASSEVEHYERIELSGVPESEIHGQVVNDLVHLLAELLENATTFSSPQTKVAVTATRLPDGRVVVEIHDKGHRPDRGGLRGHQPQAGQPPDGGRQSRPPHGPVRRRPARRPARHPRPAAPLRRAGRHDVPGDAPGGDHAWRRRRGGRLRGLHRLPDRPAPAAAAAQAGPSTPRSAAATRLRRRPLRDPRRRLVPGAGAAPRRVARAAAAAATAFAVR